MTPLTKKELRAVKGGIFEAAVLFILKNLGKPLV